jgi:hypothetical protein
VGINDLNGNPCYINGYNHDPYLQIWNGLSWNSTDIDYLNHYITGTISFNNQLFIASQGHTSASSQPLFSIGIVDINNGKVIPDFEYYYNSAGDVFYPENFFFYKSKLYATSFYSQSDLPSIAVYNSSNSNTTSINTGPNSSKKEGFEIYPNPGSKMIYLDGITGDIESMQVISLMGNIVLESAKAQDQCLNIESLPNGKYFLKIQQGGNILTRPFEKRD